MSDLIHSNEAARLAGMKDTSGAIRIFRANGLKYEKRGYLGYFWNRADIEKLAEKLAEERPKNCRMCGAEINRSSKAVRSRKYCRNCMPPEREEIKRGRVCVSCDIEIFEKPGALRSAGVSDAAHLIKTSVGHGGDGMCIHCAEYHKRKEARKVA